MRMYASGRFQCEQGKKGNDATLCDTRHRVMPRRMECEFTTKKVFKMSPMEEYVAEKANNTIN